MVQSTVYDPSLPQRQVSECKKPESTSESLARLAAKPGVQSTLVLSKSDGSIIRSTGLLATSAKRISFEASTSGPKLENNYPPAPTLDDGEGTEEARDSDNAAEHIAMIVFKVLSAGNELADGLEAGDNPKLLRIRTLKNEIVIVPGQYIWVLVLFNA